MQIDTTYLNLVIFQPGGGDGIFARRGFLPGTIVSYFNGIRGLESDVILDTMTEAERHEAGRYYIGLGDTAPFSWGLAAELTLDIPARFRSFASYRTTLGHKVNHAFSPASNADFRVVKHPLFGPICCIGTEKP